MKNDPYRYTAPFYDFLIIPLTMTFNRIRKELAPPQPGMMVLDVGCGTGSDLKLYHKAGCFVHGIDLSPGMVNIAQKKYGDSIDLRVCDGADMPFRDETFDLILSTITLHEMTRKNREDVIQEMIRVLKNDGQILLTDFSPGPYRSLWGWINRAVILILEFIAGLEHLNNGLEFLKLGGLPGLIKSFPLRIEKSIEISGKNIAFLLLKKSQGLDNQQN